MSTSNHCPGVLLLILALVLLLSPAPAAEAAQGARSSVPAAEVDPAVSETQKTFTEREILVLARYLAGQGHRDKAEVLYEALIEHGKVRTYRDEAIFQLAGIRMEEGRFRDAILLYRDMLNRNPNLSRVRLELARAYLLDRNYEEAQLQFELVRSSGLPPAVLEKVDGFLDLLRRQKDWSFDFSTSLIPDSNINQASGGEECIALGDILLCRPLAEERRGIGLSVGGSFDHYQRFSRDFGLHSTVSLYALEYEQRDFDDYQFSLASGPRLTFEQGEASFQPLFRKRWFARRQYSDEYGATFNFRRMAGSFILSGGLTGTRAQYADSNVNEVLEGNTFSARAQARYILNDRTFVQASLGFQRENTRVDSWANDSLRYGLGFYRILPFGFSLFSEFSLTTADYQGSRWYITSDYRIADRRRKDRTWQVFASLACNVLEKYRITPMLQYVYLNRTSNIWSQEYDRHRLNLSFSFRI